MKRIFIVALLLSVISSLSAYAQEMPSVAGVQYGMSYDKCKQILDSKFNNGNSSLQVTSNEIYYRDITFAGERFSYVKFYFQADATNSYLNSIEFNNGFKVSESKYAIAQRDRLLETFKQKYEFRWETTGENGFKNYVLGRHPKNNDDGFVVIGTEKAPNGAGEMKVWTSITYVPVNFVEITDEI